MMKTALDVMKAQTLEIYDIFNKDLKLTEDKARKVVSFIEDANEHEIFKTVARKMEHLATKQDLANLEIRIQQQGTKLIMWFVGSLIVIAAIIVSILK